MPNKTQNYQLNQYQPEDDFLRTDFNEDNAKVDTVLHRLDTEKCGMLFGSYTGNGSISRTIPLPANPKALLLAMDNGEMYRYPNTSGGIAFQGLPLYASIGRNIAMELVDHGLWVSYNRDTNAETNRDQKVYYYVAFL